MNIASDIQRFLNLLSRHNEVIEDVYHAGEILRTDENGNAIDALYKERVLTPREEGRYGLTRSLRDVLDDLTQRQKRFAFTGSIGEEIDRLEKLLIELLAATVETRHKDIDRNTEQIIESLYDVRELVDADILQFHQVMASKFSDVSSNDEKMRHNAHYLERADRLRKALNRLNRIDMHDRFNRKDISRAGHVYQSAISGRIESWTQSLLEISAVFNHFMFTFREIEEHTRRIRAFAQFLSEGGEVDPEHIRQEVPLCDFLMCKPAGGAREWLDIYSDRGNRALARFCADLKPIEERCVPKRDVGQRIKPEEEFLTEEEEAVEELALTYLLNHVDRDGGWVSVLTWCAQRDDISNKVFLEHVMSWLITEDEDLQYEIRYDFNADISDHMANQYLEDIHLRRVV